MAKKGIPVNGRGYKSGSHYVTSDRDGLVYRAEDIIQTWEGWYVTREDWEPRHPQDFLRVKEEKITADQPLRLDDTSNTIDVAFGGVSAIASIAVAGSSVAGTDELATEIAAGIIPPGTFNNEI